MKVFEGAVWCSKTTLFFEFDNYGKTKKLKIALRSRIQYGAEECDNFQIKEDSWRKQARKTKA